VRRHAAPAPGRRPCQVEPRDGRGDRELEQRHPGLDQRAHRRVAPLLAQLARVEAVGLDGHVGLRHEALVFVEGAHGRLLPGGVAVEGEHHLGRVHLVVVAHDSPHDLDVFGAEGGAARGHRCVDARKVAGHHVGVALDDHRLPAGRHRLLGQVEAVEHLRLLEQRGVGGVEVLGIDPVVVEQPAAPKPMQSPVMSRIGQMRRPLNRS
jgi:hypothetical protein